MSLKRSFLVLISIAAPIFSATAEPISVGVHFPSHRDNARVQPAEVAGVVAQSNWNSADGGAGGADNATGSTVDISLPAAGVLTDSAGSPSPITVTWASNGTWNTSNGTGSPDAKLMNGYIDAIGGGGSSTVSLSNIPYVTYDVIVYVGSDANGRTADVTDGTTTYYYTTFSNNPNGGGGFDPATDYTEITATAPGGRAPGNYAVFRNLSGPAQTFDVIRGSNNSGFHAVQIIDLSATDDTGSTTENAVLSVVDPGATASLTANDFGSPITVLSATNSAQGAAVSVNPGGTFTYNPTGASAIQALDEGSSVNDTFTYTISDGPLPDGLFDVQVINTGGPNPGNNTANWLSVWDALDGGAGPTGTVAGFNIVNNTSDTEVNFDYAGGGGNFGVNRAIGTIANDGPGGGPGPFNPGGSTGVNYSIRARTFIKFDNAGTYTIALGSDDGRRIELTEAGPGLAPGYTGFTDLNGQFNGAFTSGDTVIGFSGGTGQNTTRGVFSVAAGDILELDAFYYEGSGGDQGEISIASGNQIVFNTAVFSLLQQGAAGVVLSTTLSPLQTPTSTATVTVAVAGINDSPVTNPDGNSVTETSGSILDPQVSGNVLTNDTDVDDPNSAFTVTTAGTFIGTLGTLVLNTNGSYTFTLDDAAAAVNGLCEGEIVTEAFPYTMSDNHPFGNVKTANGTLTIRVTGVNDPPLGTNNTADVTEDTTTTDSGNVITDDDGSGTDSDPEGTAVSGLNIVSIDGVSNPATDVTGTFGSLDWDTDGSYTYNLNSASVQTLGAGQTATDTFTYTVADGTKEGDGVFNVRAFRVVGGAGSTDNDLNDTNETQTIWDEIDGGGTVPGVLTIGTKIYNVDQFETDTEISIDYAGGGGNFPTNRPYASINGDGPGGGGGGVTGGEDFSVRADAFLAFPKTGTYSIAVVSDDGRRVDLNAASLVSGSPFGTFVAHGGQVDAGSGTGFNHLFRNAPTGHVASVGVFEVAAGDVLSLDTFFYERGGGDSFEIAIKPGNDISYGGPGDGWLLLEQGAFGIGVGSTNSFTATATATADLVVTITGENDAPTITGSGIPDQCNLHQQPDARHRPVPLLRRHRRER